MSEKAARGFRFEKERVIAGLLKALGEDKAVEGLLRSDALAYRKYLMDQCEVSASTANKYIPSGTHDCCSNRSP